jgi:hydroxyacylglutathione hydrolase
MNINTLTVNPFQVNTYLISNNKKETIIIDPACSNEEEQDYFVSEISRLELNPKMILLTHGHIDHILGCGFMSEHYGIDVYAHHLTEFFIAQANESADLFGLNISHKPKINHYLEHGQSIGLSGLNFNVFHTPGHASGSLCFYSESESVLFSGDVLFLQSIGRTDLPTGDLDTLLNHIRQFLLVLPPQTVVYPGHGPSTTIEDEIHYNPYLTH